MAEQRPLLPNDVIIGDYGTSRSSSTEFERTSDDASNKKLRTDRGGWTSEIGSTYSFHIHSSTLVNTGNVARDHLSNERTLLSYVRTGLALTSAGVGFVELFKNKNPSTKMHLMYNFTIHHYAVPLGGFTVVLGFVLLIVAMYRYYHIQHLLNSGRFPPARTHVFFFSILVALIVAVVAIALAVAPT